MKVVVITTKPDPHVYMVSKHMREDEFIIFDPSKVSPNHALTYLWEDNTLSIKSGRNILSDAEVIWFRKPVYKKPVELPVEDLYQDFTWQAYKKKCHMVI